MWIKRAENSLTLHQGSFTLAFLAEHLSDADLLEDQPQFYHLQTTKDQLRHIIRDIAAYLHAIVEKHGASFAFPSTSLYVETLPFGTPEFFTPPGSAPPHFSSTKS